MKKYRKGGIIMKSIAVNDEEARWRRRSDAHTLAEAERIKADKERYNGAILGAKEIAQEEIERVKGIAKVAGMKTPKTPQGTEQKVMYEQPRVIPSTVVTPQFSPRCNNPATICRL